MIHIFESEQEARFFCADDVSEHLADLLKGYEPGGQPDFIVGAQPAGTDRRSNFMITKTADPAHKPTAFMVSVVRLEDE